MHVSPRSFLCLLSLLLASSLSNAATTTVNTATDDFTSNALCSLREAMVGAASNTNFGGCTRVGGGVDDLIVFDAGLFFGVAGVIQTNLGTLTQLGANNVHLQAPAGKFMVVQSNGNGPVVTLDQNAGSFSLTRVRLQGGNL
jgi:CSLREA domain-containing protein